MQPVESRSCAAFFRPRPLVLAAASALYAFACSSCGNANASTPAPQQTSNLIRSFHAQLVDNNARGNEDELVLGTVNSAFVITDLVISNSLFNIDEIRWSRPISVQANQQEVARMPMQPGTSNYQTAQSLHLQSGIAVNAGSQISIVYDWTSNFPNQPIPFTITVCGHHQ